MSTVLNNKAVLTMSTSSSCLYINYCSWLNWPQHPFTLKIPCYKLCTEEKWTVKKRDFVNVSVVINSFFLDYWYNVSLNSLNFRVMLCSRHFNFAIFFCVSKMSCNKVHWGQFTLNSSQVGDTWQVKIGFTYDQAFILFYFFFSGKGEKRTPDTFGSLYTK